MKTLGLRMLALFLLMVGVMAVRGQERDAEVPGDNFSLEGALELFKKSESPEQFEKLLNAKDSKVNNLDLNGDGYTDYIRVIDRNEGSIHTFTMQAVISDTEVQDVAVITLEKLVDGKAVLQIIGDEDVYGIETIIEPTREVRVNAGVTTTQAVVDVWEWPSVQYIYSPSYVVWVSPWSWSVRPIWWSHWHPVVYYHYDSYWRPYRPYYTQCYSPRIVYASRIYRPYRSTSVIVHRRHETQITRYRSVHRDTYVRSRSGSNPRYSNNTERTRQGEVRADKPTVRTRSNDNVTSTRTRTEVQDTRPTERNKTDRTASWNDSPVQRERAESNTGEREPSVERPERQRNADRSLERTSSVQRERPESKPVERERPVALPQRERNADRTLERNSSVQHERSTSNSAERQRPTVQRQEQPQRERVSSPSPSRSSESRESSPQRSDRSSGKSDSGSSQSQGRKRSR